MHSRIYKGWVEHRRIAPCDNRFRYRLFMLYLDLAELPTIFDRTPFWSARRPALAWFKRSDYLGPIQMPLDEAVRVLVEKRTGRRPSGPIRLLTHLRYFGFCLNPVSFYYCFDAAGAALQTIVAEITNTPWGERHQYVLTIAPPVSAPGPASAGLAAMREPQRFEFDKEFHISPFMPMDMRYRWCFSQPSQRLVVQMENCLKGTRIFNATLRLNASPINRSSLLSVLASYPFMTVRVMAGIYWQALKLYLKRAPVFAHSVQPTDQERP